MWQQFLTVFKKKRKMKNLWNAEQWQGNVYTFLLYVVLCFSFFGLPPWMQYSREFITKNLLNVYLCIYRKLQTISRNVKRYTHMQISNNAFHNFYFMQNNIFHEGSIFSIIFPKNMKLHRSSRESTEFLFVLNTLIIECYIIRIECVCLVIKRL